jgi:hypothetical protein
MSSSLFIVIVSFIIPYFSSGAPPQASRKANDNSDDIVSRLAIPDGAFCDKRVPAYLVLDNYRIKSTTALPFKNISENACAQMCSDNKDKHDKALLCSSITYQKAERLCTIHREKAKPSGKLDLVEDPKFRYYEKFCLPVFAPLDCGEALFFRAEEAVLEGSALNATKAKKLETCINTCIQRSDECKSAMYFDEVGECILNSGSAQELPSSFKEERKEKVVYFENGCILGNQVRNQAKSGTEAPGKSTTDPSVTPLDAALAVDKAIEELQRGQQEAEEEQSITTPKPEFSKWSEWNECDRPDGRRIRNRTCSGSKQACKNKMIESQWCDEAFASTTETNSTTQGPSTTPDSTSTKETQSTSEEPATTPDPSTTEDPSTTDEPTTERTTLKRKKTTTRKPSSGEEVDEPSTESLPITKHRKPSTTRKSSGEVDEDSTASPIAFFGLLFTPPAVIPKSSGAWGPWTKVCQPFGQSQQCVEGKIVGFQERQCVKTASECIGPFSRYCFIPCGQRQGQNKS